MLLRRITVVVVIELLVMAGLLFGISGNWHWWQAWVFLAVVAVGAIVMIGALYPHHKAVLEERLKGPFQREQPFADKVIVVALVIAFTVAFLLIPVHVRLHLMLGSPPALVSWLGLALTVIGGWISYEVLVVNAFAAASITHQQRQRVVDNGPYAIVRHPMYAGAILYTLGVPLWLGSTLGTIAALAPIAMFAVRAVYEERFLARELDGYAEYMERVPYRLVPGLW